MQLFRHSNIGGMNAKSTALTPFLWLLVPLLGAAVASVALAGVTTATYLLLGLCSLVILFILGLGAYFAVKNPDCLRSEKYTIQKMVIERGQIGDTFTGLQEQDVIEHQPNQRI
jgi:hypothetical protein